MTENESPLPVTFTGVFISSTNWNKCKVVSYTI